MKERVIVTGGLGYIGANLCSLLYNYDVIVIDNNKYNLDKFSSEMRLSENSTWICADLTEGDRFQFIDQNIKAVIHLAANKSVPESIEFPDKYYKDNRKMTETAISLANRLNAKLIFSSTAAVYGDSSNTNPVEELDTSEMLSPYAISKYKEECLIRRESNNYVIARFFNPIGGLHRRLSTDYTVLDNLVKASADPKGVFKIFGSDYATPDGTCIRDYFNVSDLSKQLRYLIENDSANIINLGTESGVSVKELITEFCKQASIAYEFAPRREGDVAISVASNTSLKEFIITSLADSIKQELAVAKTP